MLKRFLLLTVYLLLLIGFQSALARDVRIELHLMPPHLDPTQTPAATVAEATYGNIFQGLTRINRDGEVEPLLAKRWEVLDEGLRYIFYLQPGVIFHNGEPLTAGTAVFSLERLINADAGNPQRHLFSSIQQVRALDDQRLEVRLQHRDSLLLFRLGLSAAVLVEPNSVATNRERPIGTGPYRFVSWERSRRLKFEAFPQYWRQQPEIQRATLSFTSNRIELEASLAEGEVDFYPNISPMQALTRLAERGDYRLSDGVTEGQTLLVFNHAHPALADRRVRQALNHAVDKRGLLSIFPSATPALIGSHFSPLHPAYIDLSDFYTYDPQRAKQLLAEAGYAEGLKLNFKVPPPLYARQASLYLADNLEAIGIELDIQLLSWPEWLEKVFQERNYDLTVVAHVEPYDMDIYAREDYYFNYKSSAFRELWQKIEVTTTKKRRNELLEQAQLLLAEDAVHVFLHIKPQQSIHKKGLQGFWKNAPVPAVILEELYWAD